MIFALNPAPLALFSNGFSTKLETQFYFKDKRWDFVELMSACTDFHRCRECVMCYLQYAHAKYLLLQCFHFLVFI